MPTEENNRQVMHQILREPMMIKFRLYGFFKNLKFFEPYLLIILLAWGYSLTQIGLFVMAQQIITYLFEIPSGIIADKFGKKYELLTCFIFYIMSFLLFFLGNFHWLIVLIAFLIFGLGDAFRSGTHKAMILQWLDKMGYKDYKTFVYGRTRSWSLLGSAISGVSSIILIIFAPANRYVFLFTIVPYIADFVLISTYPGYMNEQANGDTKFLKELFKGFKEIGIAIKDQNMRKGLFTISLFNGIFKSLKDYIQPIVKIFIVALIINLGLQNSALAQSHLEKIFLGSLYSIFYLISSFASQRAYLFKNIVHSSKKAMDLIFYCLGFFFLFNSILLYFDIPLGVVIIYLFMYVLHSMRKPLGVDYLGGIMKKDQRATMLSVESQLTSIFQMSLAPLFGLIADQLNFIWLFIIVGGAVLILNCSLLQGNYENNKNE